MRFSIQCWLALAVAIWASASNAHELKLSNCHQSSTHSIGVCQRAIDGNTHQQWRKRSCTHTSLQRAWWSAETSKEALIQEVRIYNREDCCSKRLTNFAISVDGHECASYYSPKKKSFSVRTFKCNKVGRVIVINSRMRTYLTLCEVKVFGKYVTPRTPGHQIKLHNCVQSSVFAGGVCERAIDGNTHQRWNKKSCTHTALQRGWWMAQTQRLARVREVRIYNRADCCSSRLSDFVITVDGHECGSYKSNDVFMMRTFRCILVGRTVRIRSRKMTYLNMCEVQVFGHYVSRKRGNELKLSNCHQSSTHSIGVCQRAIDGNTHQQWTKRSCTHTSLQRAWWSAETSKEALIQEVRIYNREDCCSKRLTNFAISVDGHECASYYSPKKKSFSVRTFKCNKVGRVIVINSRMRTYLTLCEVKVFGKYVTPRTPGHQIKLHNCAQSSVFAGGVCQRAIDGNTHLRWNKKSCTHTALQRAWWMAKTQRPARVREVRIYNRADCCSSRLSDFVITVDGRECGSYKSNDVFMMRTFRCNLVGRTVKISSRKRTYLTLCEVEVFGQYVSGSSGTTDTGDGVVDHGGGTTEVESYERRCVDGHDGSEHKLGTSWTTKDSVEGYCYHYTCTGSAAAGPVHVDCMDASGHCVKPSSSGTDFKCRLSHASNCRCVKRHGSTGIIFS